ncbi:serine/threonine-protein phosphatase 2A regulatory subunit B' [Nematocida minor]|uniref:serine/threonine-protein phosphatase 2A regulatory subunit B' n=1 Tax=Nematocida minor TaxID=1912983 RepID=UPI00221EEE46|nr:serine/threonine-protein phosphatase 2A regulatory subunit B' [Nematocida minor]KAI5192776.1 serine/threonine-protein phosphatase 2A regulatory subunit B' [Nematocida minor]
MNFFTNVRTPPALEMILDPENDSGVYLDDWVEVEMLLRNILINAHIIEFTYKNINNILRGILSPDPRERDLCFEISLCILERSLLDRNCIINILVEFLVGEVSHYGIDLVLRLLNATGHISSEDVSEIYVPLLGKPLNKRIRKEIVYGITTVYTFSNLDIILGSILKHCRQFDSLNSFISLIIIEICWEGVESVSKESCTMAVGIFSILLENEVQPTVKKVSELLVDCDFMYKMSKNSRTVVEGLFDVVYKLSKSYWKKSEQFLACQMLESLFKLNNETFDESLRKHNHTKYIEFTNKENKKIESDTS